ncbi:hypothetical protein CVT25_006351, partial [Psilocybe cyanescens]
MQTRSERNARALESPQACRTPRHDEMPHIEPLRFEIPDLLAALPVPPVPVPVPVPVPAFPVHSAPAPAALSQPAMFNGIQYNNLPANLVQLLAAVSPAPLPPQCGGRRAHPVPAPVPALAPAPAPAPAPVFQPAIFNGIQYNNLPENLAHLLAAVPPAPLPLQKGGHNVHAQPFPTLPPVLPAPLQPQLPNAQPLLLAAQKPFSHDSP